ncbi:alpha-hydroxy-acid oxidizing protein [Kocuria palustris]|uniref:alpha-hydroxy-acid oxidizing protein n=1 Tax=Kocuria palustris TaxID=71999 RepID=UPI002FE390B1
MAGLRLRDTRNGMTIPPKLRLSTVLDASYRPEWWLNFLSTDPLSFASLSGSGASLPEVINSIFEPTLDFEDLEWICSVWPGKLFLKGVLGVEDALGADFTLIGRAYLYGLMAGGQGGAERALELLEQEMRVTMHLLGVATVDELHPGLITGA